MSSDWQSWITLGIIILTVAIFIARSIAKHRKKGDGCGSDCACPSSPPLKNKKPEK
ncbi:MAG: FeoB-associated Cys-rich membrane protein [Verrucomicrobiota bacterium]